MNSGTPLPPGPKPASTDFEIAEAALEGDPSAIRHVLDLLRAPELHSSLRARGATHTEATDILGDLAGDCFGGEKIKGGLHSLLLHYNGSCPLSAYLRHIAINRLISLKRKKSSRTLSLDAPTAPSSGASIDRLSGPASSTADDQSLIPLILHAIHQAFASADPEKLLLFRLVHSYQVPQKRLGHVWGWHESKISRAMSSFGEDLRHSILAEIRQADPWLQIEWEDLLTLCGESIDIFG